MLYKRVKSDVCSRIDYFFARTNLYWLECLLKPQSKIESLCIRALTVPTEIIYFRIIRLNKGDSLSCIVYITMTLKRQKILSRTQKRVEIDRHSKFDPVHYECAIIECILFNTLFRWSARSNLAIVCPAQPDAHRSSIKWCLIVGNKCQMSALRLIWSSNHWIDSLGNIFILYFSNRSSRHNWISKWKKEVQEFHNFESLRNQASVFTINQVYHVLRRWSKN